MSGAQTYSEMIDQPAATDAQLQAGIYPILVPSSDGGKPVTRLASAAQMGALFREGVISQSQITYNAVPISVPNLPPVPAAGGYCNLTGEIICQDVATRDIAKWQISLVVTRANNGTTCAAQGNTDPSVFVQNGTTADCSVTLSANSDGPSIILTGLSTEIIWGINLNSETNG